MNGDNITVAYSQVVACHSVESGRTIVEIIICQYQENSLLSLLSLHEHGVATEQLKGFHNLVGKGNDGVVVVDGIGNTVTGDVSLRPRRGSIPSERGEDAEYLHKAVWLLLLLEDGSSCVVFLLTKVSIRLASMQTKHSQLTSLTSFPEESLFQAG